MSLKCFNNRLIKFTKAFAMFGRKGNWVPKAEAIGLIDARGSSFTFAFVRTKDNRCASTAKPLCKMLVHWCHTVPRIIKHQCDVCFINSLARLLAHTVRQRARSTFFQPGSVDKIKFKISDITVSCTAVTCYARRIINDCQLLANQTVKQSGFAHVGTTNNGKCKTHFIHL